MINEWAKTLALNTQDTPCFSLNALYNSPQTPEERWYRSVFDQIYPGQEKVIPGMWLPKWIDTQREPSATVLYQKLQDLLQINQIDSIV